MRLSYHDFEFVIDIDENLATVIVIENQPFLTRVISEMKHQLETSDGGFVLSEGIDILPFEKNALLITDVFSLDFNNKKIINKVYSGLSSEAISSDNYEQTLEILADVEKYVIDLIEQSDVNLQYSTPDIIAIFKAFEIKVAQHYESMAEKLIDYLSLANKVLNVNCFVFVNLHSFLSNEEIKEVYKFAFYNKYIIIVLESHIKERLPCEKIFTIDKDMCSIF